MKRIKEEPDVSTVIASSGSQNSNIQSEPVSSRDEPTVKRMKEEPGVSTVVASGSQNSQVEPQPIPTRYEPIMVAFKEEPGVSMVSTSTGNQNFGVGQSIPSRFSNAVEYVNFFCALLKLESNFQLTSLNSIPAQRIPTLRWKDLPNGKVGANFRLKYKEAVWKPALNEKLMLRGYRWTGVGRVVKVPQNSGKEVNLEMETSNIPRDQTTDFSLTRVVNSTSYDREEVALRKFFTGNWSNSFLYDQILGKDVKNTEGHTDWNYKLASVPSLPSLSAEQENVVKNAILNSLTLIEGFSGSGKTVTLLSIVYHLARQKKGPILVCAQTHSVVDHLALSINRMGLKVVRLFPSTKPSDGTPAHVLILENQIREHLPPELVKLQERKRLSPDEAKKLREGKEMAERAVREEAEVICCTCVSAGEEELNSMTRKFHAILIDDSKQATEPECMIPISFGCEHLVLVSDPLQLNPIVKCEEAVKAGLKRSMFERLMSNGVQPHQLTSQFRMHPCLWYYPSHRYRVSFVNSNGVSADQRKLPEQALPWPNQNFPLIFKNVDGYESRSKSGSYSNWAEVSSIESLVTFMLLRGISPDRIGIITQYSEQKACLMELMKKLGQIEVNLVDAFQGREKDIIIVSCVRSDGNYGLGSLGYEERFHLILTRAKFGLVIVGSSTALKKVPLWDHYLSYCQTNGVCTGM